MVLRFINEAHEENFLELFALSGGKDGEKEYLASLYLLSLPLLKKKACKYIKKRAICFDDMLKEQFFSSSEKALTKLAASLFNGSYKSDVRETFYSLDRTNTEAALQAISVCFK